MGTTWDSLSRKRSVSHQLCTCSHSNDYDSFPYSSPSALYFSHSQPIATVADFIVGEEARMGTKSKGDYSKELEAIKGSPGRMAVAPGPK